MNQTIDTGKLITVRTYADNYKGRKGKVTVSYIHKMIRDGKLKAVMIDGVRFIEKN